jgi:hypothetical protein
MADSGPTSNESANQPVGTFVLRSAQPPPSKLFRQYSVVGSYADTGPTDFVRHVAVLKEGQHIGGPAEVEVYHMGPPIVAGEESAAAPRASRSCRADLLADIGLDAEEREAIRDWIAQVEKEDRTGVGVFQQYVVVPHMKWVRAPETGRRMRRRFSCAGFVIECYRAADIGLVDTEGGLPEVDEQLLLVAYPDLARLESADPRAKGRLGFKDREDLGLQGEGPWNVVLPGYLFHSLKRVTVDNPRPAPYIPGDSSESCFSG